MTRRRLACIYHIVDRANWAAVQAEGLLPADMLVRRAHGSNSEALLRRQRRRGETLLPSGVRLRDQEPMPPAALDRCLVGGLSSSDWYALINRGVYFWLDPARLRRHLRALKGPQVLIELDGEALAQSYRADAFVTAFNTGAAMRRAAARGPGTFVPYGDWLEKGWIAEEPRPPSRQTASHPPAELVIRSAIPDCMHYVSSVQHLDC